jgi:diguanylate cyclase (GGDEF)-like protein/PAS domain S-box-containing protein
MLKIYACLVNEHDLRLVALAALVCALASFTVVNLLHHVRKSAGRVRLFWLGVAATSGGFGIWATHFIAMLAFSPGIPTGYNIALTVLSLIMAIVLTGVGLDVALSRNLPRASLIGGAIIGGGIAAMHYTGMAAFEIAGRIVWDSPLVAASIALGAFFGAAATFVGLRKDSLTGKALGAVLLTVAICGHHFTAMGAATLVQDPRIAVSDAALPAAWLAVAVALASFAILLLTAAGLAVDFRDRRRAGLEADHMRGLANAAVEGLLVCDGETIVAANEAFTALSGMDADKVLTTSLATVFPDEDIRSWLFNRPNELVEASLVHTDGALIPVELVVHPIIFAQKPHHAIAVRDLRVRKRAEAHIRHLADHDVLTGLPNRRSFTRKFDHEIAAAKASGQSVALLCLDLDKFKEVNDLFGHAAGDRLLQAVARCVSSVLDERQMVARLGGDEFAIIAPELSSPAVAGRIAESVTEAFRIENENSPNAGFMSTSIGIAIFPNDSTEQESLLSHADTALYRAKSQGGGAYRFFEAAMGAEVRRRRQIEHELRHAISRDEFKLVYQPLAQISSGEIFGFEALLRWTHPVRGAIAPDVFIPIAEEAGVIIQIGEWVLRTACREAARWVRPLTLAVNVSAVQLHSARFASLVHEVLFETGLSPNRLELEITETALIKDMARTLATLRQLKILGVHIVMDDFGTGYSSLSNLRAFPFDKIKIYRSLIKSVDENEEAMAIIRAVLGLGRGLGLQVLAEGIETAGELQFLANENCTEGQGFFLGRPAPIEAFRELVHSESDRELSGVASLPNDRRQIAV